MEPGYYIDGDGDLNVPALCTAKNYCPGGGTLGTASGDTAIVACPTNYTLYAALDPSTAATEHNDISDCVFGYVPYGGDTLVPCENLINGVYYTGANASDDRGNSITGCGNTIYGSDNVIDGQQVYVRGRGNSVTGNNEVHGIYDFSGPFAESAGIYEAAPLRLDPSSNFEYTIYIVANDNSVAGCVLSGGSILISTNSHVVTADTEANVEGSIIIMASTQTTDDSEIINTDGDLSEPNRPCYNLVNDVLTAATDVDGNTIYGCNNTISGNRKAAADDAAPATVLVFGSNNEVIDNVATGQNLAYDGPRHRRWGVRQLLRGRGKRECGCFQYRGLHRHPCRQRQPGRIECGKQQEWRLGL